MLTAAAKKRKGSIETDHLFLSIKKDSKLVVQLQSAYTAMICSYSELKAIKQYTDTS